MEFNFFFLRYLTLPLLNFDNYISSELSQFLRANPPRSCRKCPFTHSETARRVGGGAICGSDCPRRWHCRLECRVRKTAEAHLLLPLEHQEAVLYHCVRAIWKELRNCHPSTPDHQIFLNQQGILRWCPRAGVEFGREIIHPSFSTLSWRLPRQMFRDQGSVPGAVQADDSPQLIVVFHGKLSPRLGSGSG